jgi:hypothetical protein
MGRLRGGAIGFLKVENGGLVSVLQPETEREYL